MSYENNQRRDSDSDLHHVPKSLLVDKRESADHISKVLNERGKRYGDFTHHAAVCQCLKEVMMLHTASKYAQLSADKKQALDVIADKIARILTGDPEYDDNWIDIQGYAKLAQERLVTPSLRTAEEARQAWGTGCVPAFDRMFQGTTAKDFPSVPPI